MEQPIIAKREVTKYILEAFGHRAKKKLGQNFLVDEKAVEAIAAATKCGPGETVLEIGPGIGTLTQALAMRGAQVKAVELDSDLVKVMGKTLEGYDNIEIINEDILKANIPAITANKEFTVAANLPYYITTPIIFALLEQHLPIKRLVMMVQKEVAERIVAVPGGKDYGALTVAMQYYTEPKLLCTVPAKGFLPPPHVESAVLVCERRAKAPVDVDEATFFKVVKGAFSVRRKMLSNALKNMGLSNEYVTAWLERAGIDGKRRGETLTIEEFGVLANTFNG
jgi:16S rRNA (adenine1518-N6/adenine1519-N6)-dimethyltransferase